MAGYGGILIMLWEIEKFCHDEKGLTYRSGCREAGFLLHQRFRDPPATLCIFSIISDRSTLVFPDPFRAIAFAVMDEARERIRGN